VSFDPKKILVIDFGQLGDVVLSLPALRSIRARFPGAHITIAVGKPTAEVIKLSGYGDDTIVVDRVELRDGFKPLSLFRVIELVKDVRRRKFDFVIDLHSLSETNLLGFLSGAPKRLYARRHGRSLEYLANFHPRPPAEAESSNRHLIDRYLDVLIPLGVHGANRVPQIKTRKADDLVVDRILSKAKVAMGTPLVGLFPGAGHPGRRWPLNKFAELADYLMRNDGVRVLVFAGPEEQTLVREMRTVFPANTLILDNLTITELAAALARLAVFVSNDTGPMHIAVAVGTSVVALLDRPTPNSFVPIENHHRVMYGERITEITTDEVYAVARELLVGNRMSNIFSR
jgi:ADP-heptose:LPS heptosyltransferase